MGAKDIAELKNKQSEIFDEASAILSVLAAPVRLKIVHFLSQAPLSVEVLAQKIDQSVANTSMHLRKMLNVGVCEVESIGQKRLYSLHFEVFSFWEMIQDFIQKIDPSLVLISKEDEKEINWLLSDAETKRLLKAGKAIILDVRPEDEISEPIELDSYLHVSSLQLKSEIKKIPKNKTILVACRGRFCAMSAFSVSYLRENGFDAYRIDQSFFKINKKILLGSKND
ncbi:MAG: helix-turn-helix domain-containing protein [Bacteriovoracaceae bacterium]|nr:helix-turn-helix domain-containing protein [Bacteriovoracaceae bacterium]